MSSVIFTSSIAPNSVVNRFKVHNLVYQKNSLSNPRFSIVHYKCSWVSVVDICKIFGNNSRSIQNLTARDSMDPKNQRFTDVSLDWEDQEQEDPEDIGSPWNGALIYKRNPSISHLEYCTTLERLGLEKLSTEISKSRASIMGLRVTKAVKDYPLGTPVQISIDVTRKKQKWRLDGIVKTVITLDCNRCGEPTAKSIFSSFSLLLTEKPIEEPEIINMGVIFGEDRFKSSMASGEEEEDDDDASIDWDDRLHFPPEETEVDISKQIRDLVHVEITIDTICDPSCKGLCLKCGTNLNTSSCSCSKEKNKETSYGPLKDLRKQMQSKG
ncbi:hypothetical protein P3X46_009526 [Hevea brasiliensis]|uniref:Uncharacterized protein n=1 Tax=Hevea brasiliensis TaxID=3981 RepID=A0ABQ9MPT1_HEVBR|nr:large ribosomal RNA subunit accumulation protein YCED homolog 1, chloroplastic isoform X2 [Hevea brasiliensis]XP_058003405.1 large ribosomal RNA subunit accumulation protein YCED homolog 1, chloroplastic isoform X2 [Hevea brasiliensis]KAJ9181392.1 hypothetical protein P3X46_009526 [Hevea brasiliensis]KAJ9181393.1 hypothetical protein P3X46_009526 [Hevea brasiliensis]